MTCVHSWCLVSACYSIRIIPSCCHKLSSRNQSNTITIIIYSTISRHLLTLKIKSSDFPNLVISTILNSYIITNSKFGITIFISWCYIKPIKKSINLRNRSPSTKISSCIISIIRIINLEFEICYSVSLKDLYYFQTQ